jgi:plasmid stabilization system protein ParE
LKGTFSVRYTNAARDDLVRLFDHLLGRAETAEDFDDAQLAIDTIKAEVEGHPSRTPFIYRKVGQSPFLRELIIPFRGLGYVALYEIEGASVVNILAVRHQLEDDYH